MRLALSAIREKRGCLELLGKVTGELDGPEHNTDFRPMFSLPDGSYPRVTVEGVRHTSPTKTMRCMPKSLRIFSTSGSKVVGSAVLPLTTRPSTSHQTTETPQPPPNRGVPYMEGTGAAVEAHPASLS